MVRRNFLQQIRNIVGLGAILPIVDACSSQEVNPKPPANFTLDLTNPLYSALSVVGGVVNVQGVFIVRKSTSAYIGLSQICTHAGCTIGFSQGPKEFVCPCHGGVYDLSGNVVSGPPPSPLARYQVVANGNILTITN